MGISFLEAPLSADEAGANVCAKSGPDQPGVLWQDGAAGTGHTHTILEEAWYAWKERDWRVEGTASHCGRSSHFSAFLPTVAGLVEERRSSALLPFAFQPPAPRGQSCFDFFSSLAFGLSRDGLAAPVG